jgi:hypothetical protein
MKLQGRILVQPEGPGVVTCNGTLPHHHFIKDPQHRYFMERDMDSNCSKEVKGRVRCQVAAIS